MKLTTVIAAALGLAATTLSAADSSVYIPTSGSGAGAAGSQWRSEVTFHNVASTPLPINVILYTSTGAVANTGILMGPRDTVTASDLIKNQLNVSGFGALEIRGDANGMQKLAVTSRAINTSPNGEFGQDVPSQRVDQAFEAGDTAVITGPYRVADYRFNFGAFPLVDTTVEWSVVRKDGTEAATKTVTYPALKQVQYNGGIGTFLGVVAQDDDVVHAKLTSGKAFFFGSIINAGTGDPSYVPALRVRENLAPTFLGIDLDENGTIDVQDANGDLIADQTVEVLAGSFPNFFRIGASDADTSALTYTVLGSGNDAQFVDANGTLQWTPSASLRGQSGTLKVRISDGFDSIVVTIPVRYV